LGRKQLVTTNIMKTKLLISTILLITFCEVTAQRILKTEDGHIEMMTLVDSIPIKAESHNLVLLLDYDSKVVRGFLTLKPYQQIILK